MEGIKQAVYGIRVKGNPGFVGVLPVKLKDFPVKNPDWDERYEEVPLYEAPPTITPKFTTVDGATWHHDGKAFTVIVDGDSLSLMVHSGARIEFIGDGRPFRIPVESHK